MTERKATERTQRLAALRKRHVDDVIDAGQKPDAALELMILQAETSVAMLDKLGDIHADLHDLWTEIEASGEALGKNVEQIRINTAPE